MRSRIWAAAFALLLIAVTAACVAISGHVTRPSAIVLALTVLAICISMGYTPDYLHLTVNPQKRPRWQIKIRWRLAGLVLVIGLFLVPWESRKLFTLLVAVVWLIAMNLLAKKIVPSRSSSIYFWLADFGLLAILAVVFHIDLLILAVLLSAAAHLSIIVHETNPFNWASLVFASAGVLIVTAAMRQSQELKVSLAAIGLVLATSVGTAWLVQRAQNHNRLHFQGAMRELMDFTGYSVDRIWELWTTSNQQLAKNWELASPDQNDPERLAQWYRENSELYMFAISAYNLEYKRIISNLRMLRFGRGACLDYGAGNGEFILELARRGHPAAYYDVEGETLKFARHRAGQRNLSVEFLHTKDDLARAARQHGFDTIFSFDVLEHLPDLPGELVFLASLLNPGGLMVFDVPAGATRSHPMHLNHQLNIHAHMHSQGLKEERPGWMPKLPLIKQEKYLFRALATKNGNKPLVLGVP
ncbi:MAG TPA: class I SAM-dependent methyltransferase [Candidatus Angelobacter sp.]|jgi:2-polyprenyl-3-methyl-5-hydroxy-6-metoxy-1,4-benzoquinol methylase|nr:class I SAM-dependent methyltransferase [Candidatus Angelobacter sp.]